MTQNPHFNQRDKIINAAHELLLIGRHEWCQLPKLGIPAIKAKVDTGAKTSTIHAFNINTQTIGHNKHWVSFSVHPIQNNTAITLNYRSPIIDQRWVKSSSGHQEHRYVISTVLQMQTEKWPIELTLSNRESLQFRMILGREALNNRVLIDPGSTCIQGQLSKKEIITLYQAFSP